MRVWSDTRLKKKPTKTNRQIDPTEDIETLLRYFPKPLAATPFSSRSEMHETITSSVRVCIVIVFYRLLICIFVIGI